MVRAFFQYEHSHGVTVAKDDGNLELVILSEHDTDNLRYKLTWGPLMEDRGPTNMKAITNVDYYIYKMKGLAGIRTECDLEQEGEHVKTLHDEYELLLDDASYFYTEEGVGTSLNVYGEPLDDWTEGVLYSGVVISPGQKSSSMFWIIVGKCLLFIS